MVTKLQPSFDTISIFDLKHTDNGQNSSKNVWKSQIFKNLILPLFSMFENDSKIEFSKNQDFRPILVFFGRFQPAWRQRSMVYRVRLKVLYPYFFIFVEFRFRRLDDVFEHPSNPIQTGSTATKFWSSEITQSKNRCWRFSAARP